MARLELKLSDLRNNVEYPVNNNTPDGRCLIHVKLTELSMKSVQSLIHSDKVASLHIPALSVHCFVYFRVPSSLCGLKTMAG